MFSAGFDLGGFRKLSISTPRMINELWRFVVGGLDTEASELILEWRQLWEARPEGPRTGVFFAWGGSHPTS